jgi:hypothetical protein
MKVVLITGLMRSGTSLAAAIVHRLGFAVATWIPAPAPPAWRSDWEDPFLTQKLMARRKIDWDAYILERKAAASVLGFKGICIKSPYLALYLPELRPRADFLLVTEREDKEIEQSMARYPQLSLEDQDEIRSALDGVRPDRTFGLEWARMCPALEVAQLAKYLGVENDYAAIEAATKIIEPMEATCPQSSPR